MVVSLIVRRSTRAAARFFSLAASRSIWLAAIKASFFSSKSAAIWRKAADFCLSVALRKMRAADLAFLPMSSMSSVVLVWVSVIFITSQIKEKNKDRLPLYEMIARLWPGQYGYKDVEFQPKGYLAVGLQGSL